jgi:porphobilinogen deaminase
MYSNAKIIPVRGNIATRINKLKDGNFEGLIVAKAALERLEINLEDYYEFSLNEMLPSASQGYIGIECLSSNNEIIDILKSINSPNDMALANAERKFVSSLNGSCLSPIAIYCREYSDGVLVSAKVLSQNGDKQIIKEIKTSYELLNKDIDDLSEEFISKDAHKLILS